MKIRKLIAVFLSVVFVFSCVSTSVCAAKDVSISANGYIDNSDVMPKIALDENGLIDHSKVNLIKANNGKLTTPDWINGLIIEEVNVAQVSPTGTFEGMKYVVDHLAEMGVNGIYIDPIYAGKHYCNYGPATVSKYLTGADTYEEGWQVVADFVKYAHSKNVRVFLDVVTWGLSEQSEVYEEHKCKIQSHYDENGHKQEFVDENHWFSTTHTSYEGPQLNWECQEMEDWFAEQLIKIIEVTDADGFRADCGIKYCGHDLYKTVRDELYSEDRYIVIIGEMEADDTLDIFDFSEHAMTVNGNANEGDRFIDGSLDMVFAVQNGAYGLFDTTTSYENGTAGTKTYYSSLVSCHDTKEYKGMGSYVPMAYASILSPFIPMWYLGEEWNNEHVSASGNQWLLANITDWNTIEDNRDYFENIKAYIRIRRLYPEIFEYFPDNHRDINICEVKTDKSMALQAYARYANGTGIMVIPNRDSTNKTFKVTIPYEDMKLSSSKTYTVINMLTGAKVGTGTAESLKAFKANIEIGDVAVYIVTEGDIEGNKPSNSQTTEKNNQSTITDNNKGNASTDTVSPFTKGTISVAGFAIIPIALFAVILSKKKKHNQI